MLVDVGVYVEPDSVQHLKGIFILPATTANRSTGTGATSASCTGLGPIVRQVAYQGMPVVLIFGPGPQFKPQAYLVGHLIIDVGDEAQLLLDLVLHGLYCLWVCLPAPYLAGELTELLL